MSGHMTASTVSTGTVKRRRCIAACTTCKRRKERCDGHKPCSRCAARGAQHTCQFVGRNRYSIVTSRSGTTNQFADEHDATPKDRTRSLPRLHSPPDCAIFSAGRSEERAMPARHRTPVVGSAPRAPDGPWGESANLAKTSSIEHAMLDSSPSAASDKDTLRMIQDPKGHHMFIGDSANLAFLQTIRRLAERCVGSCAFVDDPLRCLMVEATSTSESLQSLRDISLHKFTLPELRDAQTLVKSYGLATNCVLDLFDEEHLLEGLPAFLGQEPRTACTIADALYYLILAIGAQTHPSDRDETAATFFKHGRILTTFHYTECASIGTVQSSALITFYLLGASRRNAAFMHLGIAVRAAYAIGLHRKDVNSTFSRDDFETRERVWKVLRILDLFMSASLGRPPSTSETRDTEDMDEYSASTDLCAIFEKILTDIYSRRMVSTEALTNIGAHHRRWASRFVQGLATDKIQATDTIEGGSMPNIGLLHVKEAYYWTIILLTRPFLTESVSIHAAQAKIQGGRRSAEPCISSADSNKVLVEACVLAAIRTIDLLKPLLGCGQIPKRLPYVVNSIFIAALVLGMAYFGDLYQLFSLEHHLDLAKALLEQFTHDAVAQRSANIVMYLREACRLYVAKRNTQNADHSSNAIASMFGQIHGIGRNAPSSKHNNTFSHSNSRNATQSSNTPGLDLTQHDSLPPESIGQTSGGNDEPNLEVHDTSGLYDLLVADDMTSDLQPFEQMSPRTLWFQAYDESVPMFSMISEPDVT